MSVTDSSGNTPREVSTEESGNEGRIHGENKGPGMTVEAGTLIGGGGKIRLSRATRSLPSKPKDMYKNLLSMLLL